MTWQRTGSSKRRLQLPADWPTIRRAVIQRDQVCVQCGAPGNQVDHIGNPLDHSLSNLQLLCAEDHKKKTARQGITASRKRAALAYRPGLAPWQR